ncbi:MAG: site-2 protease family protein [Gemmatimonadaceae bacterium]
MQLQDILLFVPVLLFSVIAHEVAHGYAALKQGDDTALSLGRLTWNPIKHIDPFMTLILPVMLALAHLPIIGGAKPVPVDPRNYRRPIFGDIVVSLAGVFTNLLVAIGCALLFAVFGLIGERVQPLEPSLGILQAMMFYGVELNMILIAFNLIPIPPLDGSHVVKYLMPRSWALLYVKWGRWGLVLIIAAMYFKPDLFTVWLNPAIWVGNKMIYTVRDVTLFSARQWIQ